MVAFLKMFRATCSRHNCQRSWLARIFGQCKDFLTSASGSGKFFFPARLDAAQGEFKNRRKIRSRRGNEAEVFFAPKFGSLSAATILELTLDSGAGRFFQARMDARFLENSAPMQREIPSTNQKALQINLDKTKYGTFAEIGAGQEVARWFFRAGGAAGTIAKTISAYDMTVSDAIYGPCERYVSRQRLQSMLEHEYALILERLKVKRGGTTRFFVFANTVAARSYSRQDEAHGWMGVRFQTAPQTDPSEIIIHVRMLDKENLQEQEALGIIGVNLIYGALLYFQETETLLVSLMDNLNRDRIEVDTIK